MFIAIKELQKEKLRFTMILNVIVLIAYLVYFLSSLAFGLSELNRTAIDHWESDGVVITEVANGNLYASTIDVTEVVELRGDNTELVSLSSANATINDGKSDNLVFMGFDEMDSSIIPTLIEGENPQSDFEVLISSSIRDKEDVVLGDEITISNTNRVFKVVGFTEASNFNTVPVVYGKREMVSELMMNFDTTNTQHDANTSPTVNMPDRLSFVVVKDQSKLELETLPEGLIYTDIDAIINKLPGYTAQVLTFGLMIISLSFIVSVIMGIFMYILTMQKKSVFAVLKIQGYQNKKIIQSIVYQILLLVLSGLLISFALNQITVSLLPPQVPVQVNSSLILIVSVFILLTSLIGAVFSAYSVLKIDPLEAL